MLKKILAYYHIQFQKDDHFRVFIQLFFLLIAERIWKLKKWLRGIDKPVVHLYTTCWNEAKILPFMLQHYAPFVDRFIIYDNYSDDETDRLLAAYSNVTIHKFDTGERFDEFALQNIRNNVWKQSRGKADWVIMADTDELLYHPNMQSLLLSYKHTIFTPKGYNMVAAQFPSYENSITQQITHGVPNNDYSKKILFNPHQIVEINFNLGSHWVNPNGIVHYGTPKELKLLHYKNLGVDYIMERILQYQKRVPNEYKQRGISIHYDKQRNEVEKEISEALKQAVSVF